MVIVAQHGAYRWTAHLMTLLLYYISKVMGGSIQEGLQQIFKSCDHPAHLAPTFTVSKMEIQVEFPCLYIIEI